MEIKNLPLQKKIDPVPANTYSSIILLMMNIWRPPDDSGSLRGLDRERP